MIPVRSRTIFCTFTLLLCCFCTPANCAQSEEELRSRLVGKTMFLRGGWIEDKLKFDGTGQPEKSYKSAPFTVAAFRADDVTLSGDVLSIEGVRIGTSFDSSGAPHQTVMRVSSKANAKDEVVTVEIDGHGNMEFTAALGVIFAEGIEQLLPTLPAFWQPIAHRWASEGVALGSRVMPHRGAPAPPVPDSSITHIDNTVHAPKLIHSANPRFTDWARRMKFSGTAEVYVVVNQQGLPEKIELVRPIGMGLDEQALEAVSQYRFKPATRDGVPVRVDLYVEVNFQIF